MLRIIIYLLLTFLVSSCNSVSSGSASNDIASMRSDFYDNYLVGKEFNGQVLIAKDNNTIYSKVFGFSNLEKQKSLLLNDTYLIGSLTKQFTSLSILLLEEKGLLKVTDSLDKYYKTLPETWKNKTLHDLMTHSSGLPDIEDFEGFEIAIPYSTADFLSKITQLQLPSFPEGQFRYSSIGFMLLSDIVEKTSGMIFCEFLDQKIFTPLGMTETGCMDPMKLTRLSTLGYQEKEDGQLENKAFTYETFSEGSGNLYSNLEGLMIWDESIRTRKLLSKSGYKKWLTGYVQVLETSEYEDKDDWLGYGWFLRYEQNKLVKAYHLGGVTGYKASITRFPEEQILVITLSNIINEHSNVVRMEFPKLVYKKERL